MTYDWTKHLKGATLEGRAVEGGGGPAVVKTLSPKGFLKLNTGITYVIESLQYFDGDELDYLYDLIMWISELDFEWPFLTGYNRKAVVENVRIAKRNSGAADFDLSSTDVGSAD